MISPLLQVPRSRLPRQAYFPALSVMPEPPSAFHQVRIRVDGVAGHSVISPSGAVRLLVATKPVDFRKGAETTW